MKKQIFKQFTTPVHYCTTTDDLCISLQYIHFHNGFMLASDAWIGCKIPIERFGFDSEDIAMLNGHSIHRSQFQLILKREVFVEESLIRCNNPGFYIKLKKTTDLPQHTIVAQIEALFAISKERTSLLEIGMNPHFIIEVAKALGIKYGMHFYFSNKQKSVVVEGVTEIEKEYGKGLVMPVMLEKTW